MTDNTANEAQAKVAIRIWDLPLRLFHVCFALSVIGAIAAVKLSDDMMDWHVRLGIISLALLVFRLIWGFVGSYYSRFSQFVNSPAATLRYLRSTKPAKQKTAGHNPLGSWSVLAMLLIIGIQATTGLFTSDHILTEGPLVSYVSQATSKLLTKIHHLNEKPLYFILALHLLAILVYTLRGHGLIRPMLSGDVPAERLPPATIAACDTMALRLLALVIAVVIGFGAYYLLQLS